MTASIMEKPATAATVNGLQRDDQLGRLIGSVAKPNSRPTQAYRLVHAGWIVARQNNGWRRSVPVFRRRRIALRGRA